MSISSFQTTIYFGIGKRQPLAESTSIDSVIEGYSCRIRYLPLPSDDG